MSVTEEQRISELEDLITAHDIEENKPKFVISVRIWVQVSSDYQASERLRTKVFSEETLKEVAAWANDSNRFLGRGDIKITEAEAAK